MMSRNKSDKGWLREHFSDEYVRRARREGYRSRAVYKLVEIDRRDKLFRQGMTVVDLGAAPGSWSQYARRRVGPQGRVLALDILPMAPLDGVEVIQGDFTEPGVLDLLISRLAGAPVDIVISDIAPNISGIAVSDQARASYVAEVAVDFAQKTLRPGGQLLLKVFQGGGENELRRQMRRCFGKLVVRKPRASRSRSAEMYLLGKGYSVVTPHQT